MVRKTSTAPVRDVNSLDEFPADETFQLDYVETPAKPAKNRDRVQQLMREKAAAEALAQRSMAEATALREQLEHIGRAQDYKAPEEFTKAVAQNAVREAGADLLQRQADQAKSLAARAAFDAWTEATAEFRRKMPDFDEVAHNPDVTITPIMADAIRESERGPEIAYYLGKNPNEARRISTLSPIGQATAIVRLEFKLAPAEKTLSLAPEPFSGLTGRGGNAARRLEDMPYEDYRKVRGF